MQLVEGGVPIKNDVVPDGLGERILYRVALYQIDDLVTGFLCREKLAETKSFSEMGIQGDESEVGEMESSM